MPGNAETGVRGPSEAEVRAHLDDAHGREFAGQELRRAVVRGVVDHQDLVILVRRQGRDHRWQATRELLSAVPSRNHDTHGVGGNAARRSGTLLAPEERDKVGAQQEERQQDQQDGRHDQQEDREAQCPEQGQHLIHMRTGQISRTSTTSARQGKCMYPYTSSVPRAIGSAKALSIQSQIS